MGYTMTSAALAPILAVQGRRVRRRAARLPEPPGPRQGSAGAGLVVRLLIVGDSAAAGVGAPSQAEALSGRLVAELAVRFRVHWALVARTGATTAGTARHLARRPIGDAERFDVAVLSLGGNDVMARRPLTWWLADLDEVAALLHGRFGVRRLLVSGLPPMDRFTAFPQPLRWYLGMTARRYDRALARWAAGRDGCRHVPLALEPGSGLLAPDGLHPGPMLYARWAAELASHVRGERADDAAPGWA